MNPAPGDPAPSQGDLPEDPSGECRSSTADEPAAAVRQPAAAAAATVPRQAEAAAPRRPAEPARPALHPAPAAVSVIIPVFNEEPNLEALYRRLAPVMDDLAAPASASGGGASGGDPHAEIGVIEAIFVDDGSVDRSLELLRGLAARDRRVRVLSFNRNYGQHAAVMAGLEVARGETIVTLDADLQNPPEDIPRLLAKIGEGFDVVGGYREHRQDTLFRRLASRLINHWMRRILAGVEFRDYGCMLRAYSRPVVDSLRRCEESSPFIPALACQFARRIAEVPVGHAERAGGESKYSLWRLLKLQADLVTGFTSGPLRLATLAGSLIALLSIGFGVFLGVRRLLHGPEAEGVFTLFAILFFLVGADFLALGVLGEYVGRIYIEVRRRPRSVIKETINFPARGEPGA
ncbi:MAG TPA: glycosyltransferase [Thermoanaerobaculia bacterium]|nr:glycosyltransferase [Thermoanaerobaculia bacterium]